MNDVPRISIVTPSYNQGRYLEETIRSVLEQDYPDLQYVVIDGGSTDSSVEVLRRYDDRLDHWESGPDRGQAHALNKGFALCDGEIFAYLNSDDLYRPGTLRRVAEAYRAHPDPERFLWACSVEDFEDDEVLARIEPRATSRLADWIDYRAYLHQPGVFWSAELHRAVGGFDESLDFAFDRKFFVGALMTGARLATEPGFVGARFRRHAESKTERIGHVDRGFAPEIDAVSEWARAELTVAQRLGVAVDRVRRSLGEFAGRLRMRLGALRRTVADAVTGRLSRLFRRVL